MTRVKAAHSEAAEAALGIIPDETTEEVSRDEDVPAPEPGPALLPLDEPRVVAFKVKNRVVFFRFRRITAKDWQTFFTSIVHRKINVGSAWESIYEAESAQIELVNNTLIAVEGYGDTGKVKNWKASLPLRHRIAAGMVLRNVGPVPGAEEELLSDTINITLDAMWSAGEQGNTLFKGLVHRFRQPTIEQLRLYNFESARVRVEGTADSGVTTFPSRQLIAMKIYDELIESVDGYSVHGVPLEGIENIKSEMDGAHKAEAALALFTQGDSVRVA